jgi:phytoene/squalene synthetase
VDTYRGSDAGEQLDRLYTETLGAIDSGYSANPVVHAFADTARQFDITAAIIRPFFASMRTDITATRFTKKAYAAYIYGSAEVVGLMCLKVFTRGDAKAYTTHTQAASALGAAYQKVNFLRDMHADYAALGRVYFPGISFESFDDVQKNAIVAEIERDFAAALPGIRTLPLVARRAVRVSYYYYSELLTKLKNTPADTIKTRRIRLPNSHKLRLLLRARSGR